jgi:hypothetical protein
MQDNGNSGKNEEMLERKKDMCQKKNYQKELEKIIEEKEKNGIVPTLFLHACCAPCSSYCLEYLAQYFKITVFYYNPNISPKEEYEKRVEELEHLIGRQEELLKNAKKSYPIRFLEGKYDPERFYEMAKGMEDLPEGGERCFACYELRLREAAETAAGKYDFFTTTLSISPHKNAQKLNEIGERIGKEYGIAHLPADFKKKNGYRRSCELSEEFGLYRQNYCGCVFSKR